MIEIRKMKESEALEVRKIGKKAFVGIERFFIGKPKEVMVAVIDGKIVGGIIIKYIISKGNKIGYYDGAFIHPDFHGQGVGAKLYERTTEYLWEQGCTVQSAFVKDDNVGSWKLFLNNGFSHVSFFEGVKTVGVTTMIKHYFTTPFFISNGMEFYLASRNTKLESKKINTPKNICMFLLVNLILMLFGWIGSSKNYPLYLGAYLTILSSEVVFSYIGTLFSKRNWHFRLNSGGAALVAFFNFLGGFYPMIGNWYPEKYENTDKFRRDMGVVATFDWIALIGITVLVGTLQGKDLFSNYMHSFGCMLLFYKMIPFYPLEGFGGGRVYSWDKRIYAVLVMVSAVLLALGFI